MRSFDLVSTELVAFELLALLFPLVLLAAMGGARGTGASTKETLDRRYASGEITREDYLNIRDDITRDGDA